MSTHAVGARVVELLFSTIPAKHTNGLRQEFYGPHFSLFADAVVKTPTLQSNIDAHPDKKEPACHFVLNTLIQKGIDKGLFGFAYFQQLLSEYCAVVGGTEMRSEGLVSNLVDHSLHLLSTRAGAQVVVRCVAYGTAKDRKRILKSLKGYARSSLMHRDAYLAILQIILVTDDTVSVHKSLLAELLSAPEVKGEASTDHPLLGLALDDHASRLLLLLMIDDEEVRKKHLDPLERELLQTNPTVVESGEEVPTSKKNPETRRKELFQYVRKPFLDLCLQHSAELAKSLPGSRVVQQVYKTAGSSEELKESLIQLCVDNNDAMQDVDESSKSLLEDPVGHYLIKHLVTEHADFAETLADAIELDKIESSRAAFVVTALCKSEQRDKVVKAVTKPKLKKLLAAKKEEKVATAGFEALLKALEEKE
jgi:pumilio family protein 6